MIKKQSTGFAYLALLALSLPVPVLHFFCIDRVIETMRPVIKTADGGWAPMLMPVPILFLRWLGELSLIVALVVLILFILSFKKETYARFSTVCALAICQCAFTTFYAFYGMWLLGLQWLEWIHPPV